MEDFNFTIAGDGGRALKTIEHVLSGLDSITPHAAAAGAGISRALGPATNLIEQHARMLRQGGQAAINFSNSTAPMVAQLRQTVEVLRREQVILQEIHAPMRTYATDVQALNQLLARGEINAAQFNARLMQAKQTIAGGAPARGGGGLDMAGLAGSLPGGSVIAGAIGGGVAGAAQAGIQMAAGSIHTIIEMSDAYTGLNNRLRSLTGSQEAATALFDKLHASANKTRSDVTTTAESFVRFQRATQQLGASQEQTLRFTEHLNMQIALSGADAVGASAAMLQLSQALASGRLRGEEFNSIIEQAPALLDPIAQKLGVNTGQLRGLAEQGKITSQVIFEAYEGAGGAGKRIERAFGDSIPTISQQLLTFKNDITVTVGQMMQQADVSKMVGDSIKVLGDVIAATAEQTKLWGEVIGLTDLKLSDLAGGGGGGIRATIGFFKDLDFSVTGFKNALTGSAPAQTGYRDQQQIINRVIAEGTGKLRDYYIEQTEGALAIGAGAGAATAFANATRTISDKAQKATEITKAWGEVVGNLTTGLGVASHALDKLGQALNDSPLNRALGIGQQNSAAMRDARIQLEALKTAHETGAISGKNYQSQYESLMTTLNNGQLPATIRLWHQIHDPIDTYKQDVAALNSLLQAGAISFEQYTQANRKAAESYQALTDEGALLLSIHGSEEQALRDIGNLWKLYDTGKIKLGEYNNELQKRLDLLSQIRIAEIEGLGGIHTMPTPGVGQKAEEQPTAFSTEYLESLVGKNASMSKRQAESLTNMWNEQLEQIRTDNERYAQLIAKAWAPVEDAIKNAALTGKFEWKDFTTSMEQSLNEIAVQILKTAALTALLGPGGKGGGLLGNTGSFGISLFGALGGGAVGFDYMASGRGMQLPGFATGGDMFMRGGGTGTDTVGVAFRMSQGESLHVRTPGQRRAAEMDSDGGLGGVTIAPEFKILMPRDRRALVDDSRQGLSTLVKLVDQLSVNRR
jgi:tape measure domain-containing protein